ncbi:zinc finger protein 11-like [Oppia nitens]|uniref:zinc finger protein 11-like n=1 Tax=Oppia nitens TaxID=1686743 RepID=UPI0023DAB175|nr:zinc finger protein 11-like [Oppia nitens]
MCEIVVNDLFDEIINENNRLCNQLVFAMKCLDVLKKFETFVRKVMTIKTIVIKETQLSSQEVHQLTQLDVQLREVMTQLKQKSAQSMESNEKVDQLMVKNIIDNNDKQSKQIWIKCSDKGFKCIRCQHINDTIHGLIRHLKTNHSITYIKCTNNGCNEMFLCDPNVEKKYICNKHMAREFNRSEEVQQNKCVGKVVIRHKDKPIDCQLIEEGKRKKSKAVTEDDVQQNRDIEVLSIRHVDQPIDCELQTLRSQLTKSTKTYSKFVKSIVELQVNDNNGSDDNNDLSAVVTAKTITGDDVQQNNCVGRELIKLTDQSINCELQSLTKSTKTYSRVVESSVKLQVIDIGSDNDNDLSDNCHNQSQDHRKTVQQMTSNLHEKRFPCFDKNCDYKSCDISGFIDHLKTCHPITRLQCTHKRCYKLFANEKKLKRHLLMKHKTYFEDFNEEDIVDNRQVSAPKDSVDNRQVSAPKDSVDNRQVSAPVVNNQTVIDCKQTTERFKCYHIDCGKRFNFKQGLGHHLIEGHVRTDVNKLVARDDISLSTNELCLTDQIMSKDEILVNTELSLSVMDKTTSKLIYKPYKCDYKGCDFRAASNARVVGHQAYHNQLLPYGRSRPYLCPQESCDRRFVSRESMDRHRSQFHSTNRTYRCDYIGCRWLAPNELILKKHMQSHKQLRCSWPGCQYKTIFKSVLKKHEVVHSTERNWLCCWPGCDYRAKRKKELISHTVKHTVTDNNFVCDWPECGKRFRTAYTMKTHQTIHKGTVPVMSCEWEGCLYKSIRKQNMTQHINSVHLKLKRK